MDRIVLAVLISFVLSGCAITKGLEVAKDFLSPEETTSAQTIKCPSMKPPGLSCEACNPWPFSNEPEQIEDLQKAFLEAEKEYNNCKDKTLECVHKDIVWDKGWDDCP